MKRLKNNNGFTLVELIISMLIMTIVMGLTMAMMISVGNMYTSSSNQNISKEIGDGVFELIENNLKYASGLEIVDSSSACTQGYDKAICVDPTNGHLLYKASAGDSAISLYNNGFYNGRKIEYKLEQVKLNDSDEDPSLKHIKLTVNVLDGDEIVYKRSNTVKCINLTLSSKSNIVFKADSSKNNRYISFDSDKLVYENNSISYNFYNRLLYVQYMYNYINDCVATGDMDNTTARNQISTLFGGYNPADKYSSSDSLKTYNGVYGKSNEILYGVLKNYYNNNGTLSYPSFDKPSVFFNDTYFGNRNMDMAIVAYFHVSLPTSSSGSNIESFVIYSVPRDQLATLDNNTTTHGTTYTKAQIVYNSGKNTWYYQPANANLVTDIATMLGWYKNEPKTYDISNKSSTIVNADIDENKVYKSITIFKRDIDVSSSTVWMPLPKSSYKPS